CYALWAYLPTGIAGGFALVSHFFRKLAFSAAASGLPFFLRAFGSEASLGHFVMKLFRAAPASGLPFLPAPLLWALYSALAGPAAATLNRSARPIHLMASPPSLNSTGCGAATHRLFDHTDDCHQHAATEATGNDLLDNRTNIETTRRCGTTSQYSAKNLAA